VWCTYINNIERKGSKMFNTSMKFKETEIKGFYESTNAQSPCYIEYIETIGWCASFEGGMGGGPAQEQYFDTAEEGIHWLECEIPHTVYLGESIIKHERINA